MRVLTVFIYLPLDCWARQCIIASFRQSWYVRVSLGLEVDYHKGKVKPPKTGSLLCLRYLSYLVPAARKFSFAACKQLRCRPACASAQFDQRLRYSLSGKYCSQACDMWNFLFLLVIVAELSGLSITCCENLEDRFSRTEAQFCCSKYCMHPPTNLSRMGY